MPTKKTVNKPEAEEAQVKKTAAPKAEKAPAEKKAAPRKAAAEKKPAAEKKAAPKAAAKTAAAESAVKAAKKPAAKKAPAKEAAAEKPVRKTVKKAPAKAAPVEEAVKEPVVEQAAPVVEQSAPIVEQVAPVVEQVAPVVEQVAPVVEQAAPVVEQPVEEVQLPQPRRSVAFIGSECYPFVKTGGLGDVMYALPKALTKQNCDVKVILPRYRCIPQKYQDKMIYRGEFWMNLCSDGRSFYVGIMEYVWDGVVYDFIDNEDFFGYGNPYTNLVDDIPRYCFFAKAALAALNYMNWVPDIIHCHDWQAALVPVYLRTLFNGTPVASAKTVFTIHNLRFQGVYNIPTIKYWTGLPDHVFSYEVMKQGHDDANMLKGGLTYADRITTVSATYAGEIQTPFYGDGLDGHLRYHSGRLRGIVNGIDVEQWDSSADKKLAAPYDRETVLEQKKANKRALQEALGLEVDENKFVIGLISRLTDQKGLDLVNAILPALVDGNTQVAVLGTGEPQYEDSFRYFEQTYKGSVCAYIAYDEALAHRIYAGADALLVPSLFEPCGLTQLIAMRYGTVPVVRETGGLKDTVQPYNEFTNEGNGFTFDRYESGLLLDAINRAKTVYFTQRDRWDEMVRRDMDKDVSWDSSAVQYRNLYLELKP